MQDQGRSSETYLSQNLSKYLSFDLSFDLCSSRNHLSQNSSKYLSQNLSMVHRWLEHSLRPYIFWKRILHQLN